MTAREPATSVTARACANIALVKYWGKRDAALNLPAAGSLSLTLAALVTETTVAFDPRSRADELVLDGAPARPATRAHQRVPRSRARRRPASRPAPASTSRNDFPTASGLASSASGFAALALAATRAAGLALDAARAVDPRAPRLGLGGALDLRRLRAHARRRRATTASDAFAEPIDVARSPTACAW